jgi:hypothetical protein
LPLPISYLLTFYNSRWRIRFYGNLWTTSQPACCKYYRHFWPTPTPTSTTTCNWEHIRWFWYIATFTF